LNTVTRVVLIRHGQTDWNAQDRWQGQTPVPLNAIGYEQAAKLAEHLKDFSLEALYTSDIPRAYQTAAVVGDAIGLQPLVDVRLRELRAGRFEGLSQAVLRTRFAAELLQWNTNLDYTPPGGESRRKTQERALHAFRDITTFDPNREIAIVTHGGTIRLLLMRLFRGDQAVAKARISNTAYTILERAEGGWHMALMPTTPHLNQEAALPADQRAG
jgi:broad specificity phosphatase PhoE